MIRRINPASITGPFATYAYGVKFASPVRWLFGNGQTGVDLNGTVPSDIEGQTKPV
jgi:hypothetical protein